MENICPEPCIRSLQEALPPSCGNEKTEALPGPIAKVWEEACGRRGNIYLALSLENNGLCMLRSAASFTILLPKRFTHRVGLVHLASWSCFSLKNDEEASWKVNQWDCAPCIGTLVVPQKRTQKAKTLAYLPILPYKAHENSDHIRNSLTFSLSFFAPPQEVLFSLFKIIIHPVLGLP